MANITGGSVVWNFDVDKRAFDSGLNDARDRVNKFGNDLKKNQSGVKSWAGDLGDSFSSIATGLGSVLKGAAALAVGGSFGLTAMANAAWGQVSAVENASFALRAYEQDAGKVNNILKELVAFARSDMGVLFQREDLFKAASNLRGFGDAAENVVEHVKVLSKGVSLGMTTFDELSQIIGRATQQGKISAETFDMLAQRGIILDSSFRGAAVTTEQLYGELNRVLPDSLLEGRANTIQGLMIRLQSAFRDLGGAILGIDKDTSTFVKGGLGDTLVKMLGNLRTMLRDPAMVETFKNIGASLANFAKNALPPLLTGLKWILNNLGTVVAVIGALTTAFIAASVAATVLGIVFGPITLAAFLIAAGITALIAVIAFLQIRFNVIGKIIGWVSDHFTIIRNVVIAVIAVAFLPLTQIVLLVIAAFKIIPIIIRAAVKAFQWISNVIGDVVDWFSRIGKIVGKALGVALEAIVGFVKAAGEVFMGILNVVGIVFGAIWNVIRPILDFIKNLFIIVFGSILLVVLTVLEAIKNVIMVVFGVIFKVVSTALQAIWEVVSTVWNAIWGVINTVIQFIWNRIVTAFNFWKDIITAVLNALFTFIAGIWNSIWETIKSVADRIINFFSGAWNWLYNKGKDIVLGLAGGIKAVAGEVWNAIKSVADRIGSFFSGAWNWLYDVGRAIVEGLVRGIKSMVSAVGDAAGNIGNAVKNKVKSLLGISSPSKVMAQYGQWTMEGFSQGLEKGNAKVMEAIGSSLDPVYEPTISPSVSNMPIEKGPAPIINHIGEIHIASEVDGENWLKKLTREEEVTSTGLTPYAV